MNPHPLTGSFDALLIWRVCYEIADRKRNIEATTSNIPLSALTCRIIRSPSALPPIYSPLLLPGHFQSHWLMSAAYRKNDLSAILMQFPLVEF